jgi:hypothetical protein
MMGGKTPETCCAVNKRQDNKLKKLLHQVGDLFELNIKLRCQNVKGASLTSVTLCGYYISRFKTEVLSFPTGCIYAFRTVLRIKTVISLHRTDRLIFLMKARGVFSEVRTDSSHNVDSFQSL